MKNKFIPRALVLLACAFALAGCGQKNKPADDGRLSVVTTIFPPYDFARAIAGGKAEITMLLPPGAETHSFEPRPQDIIKIQKSGVFIYTGGESDTWVENILKSMDTSKMKIIAMTECVETVEEEIVEGMQDDGEEGEHARNNENGEDGDDKDKPEYDEHVWTSPRNAKAIVRKIADALIEADSANADAYRQNAEAYIAELDVLDAKIQSVVDSAVRKTLVFGDRFPFRYFTDAYGLRCAAAFPGCAAETEASPQTIRTLIQMINEERIPVVFHIELSNRKMAQAICEVTGAQVRLMHACHNISKEDFEAGESYLSLMRRNAEALKEALW